MSDDIRIYLIVQTSIRIVVDASFLMLYLMRIHKLDRMASNNFHSKPKLMKFKLLLLLLLQLVFLIHIALSFTVPTYWVFPYKDFALVSIADFLNCFLQIYMVRKEHKKKAVKSIKVGVLWVLWLVLDVANIIAVEVQIPSTTIFLIIFEGMVLVALIVIGFLLQQKNEQREEIINGTVTPQSPLMKLMTDEGKASLFYTETISSTHDFGKLYVEFNKEFNVIMKQSQAYYEFRFAVIVGQDSVILTRKEEEFEHLVNEMICSFPDSEELVLKEKKHSSFSNIKKYGQEKQKIYETYLVKLTQNQKYYTNSLLDFLDLSSHNRAKLTKRRQKNHSQKKDSFHNDDQEKQRKPFFNVQILNNKIHISNSQILEITLNKSRSQIQKFHNKLIAQKKLKIQLIPQNPNLTQLSHFIFRVVNSKHLWRFFTDWMVLGKDLQQKIYNMFDFWNYGFRNIQLSIIGYEIAFDKEGSLHNLYLLSLSRKKKQQISYFHEDLPQFVLKQNVTLKKRFNDFVKLDKNVRKFINLNNIKSPLLMNLPPKFSPFGTKTSPKSRQIYLDMYINELSKIQEISKVFIIEDHCVKFLQFLQVDLGRFREEFQKVDENNLIEDEMPSMIIDDLEERL